MTKELQVNQHELEIQNEIAHIVNERQTIFNAIPNPVFLLDADGVVTQCNIATERLTANPRARSSVAIAGKSCIVHPNPSRNVPSWP